MPKIVRFHKTGGPEVLKIAEEPLVQPKEGEVRLRVQALGLNRAEAMFRSGAYLETPQLPSRLGYEAAGIVDAIGAGVSNVKVGDRVSTIPAFGLSAHGVYGESAVVPAFAVASYPEHFTPEQGSAFVDAVHHRMGRAGGARAIGERASRADHRGEQQCRVGGDSDSEGSRSDAAIAATRKADKKAKLLQAGADHVVVTEQEDLPERVKEISGGKGANVIFDPVSGPYVETLAQAAAAGATMLIYGALDMRPTPYPLFPALQKGLWIHAFVLFECTTQAPLRERAKRFVNEGVKSGAFKPIIDPKVFTLDKIVDAHRYLESNQQFGKVVVRV